MPSKQLLRKTDDKHSQPLFAAFGWAKTGGNVFVVFSSISAHSNHSACGRAEHYDSQPSDYPKFIATLEWAKQHGQAVAIGE
jgi:hypothetical protein